MNGSTRGLQSHLRRAKVQLFPGMAYDVLAGAPCGAPCDRKGSRFFFVGMGIVPFLLRQESWGNAGLLLRSPGLSLGHELSSWGPGATATRPALVASLQRLLPPSLMVPDGRLEHLVEQALDAQVTCTHAARPEQPDAADTDAGSIL